VSNSLDFASKVLEQAKVAVVPGSAFGCDENVRLSFATSMENIQKGLDRLEQMLGKA
jgi:aspartate aminotransferase